mmetsp:Transcript_20398/g.54610  ORF Transcript_20398/g.54610 Transcript_20398/m.54610 type:complete len:201 (+) Transcript_20398:297-899(+)
MLQQQEPFEFFGQALLTGPSVPLATRHSIANYVSRSVTGLLRPPQRLATHVFPSITSYGDLVHGNRNPRPRFYHPRLSSSRFGNRVLPASMIPFREGPPSGLPPQLLRLLGREAHLKAFSASARVAPQSRTITHLALRLLVLIVGRMARPAVVFMNRACLRRQRCHRRLRRFPRIMSGRATADSICASNKRIRTFSLPTL